MGMYMGLFFTTLVYLGTSFQIGRKYEYLYKAESDVLGMGNITTSVMLTITPVEVIDANLTLHELKLESVILQSYQQEMEKDNKEMTLPFYYEMARNGNIKRTYYSPEEHYDWLVFKTMIVSSFSHHIQEGEGDRWQYGVHEEDHAGIGYHQYEATRQNGALKLKRTHKSEEPVMRRNLKHIEFHEDGHINHVRLDDEVRVKHEDDEQVKAKISGIHSSEYEDIDKNPRDVRLRSTGFLTFIKTITLNEKPQITRDVLSKLQQGSLKLQESDWSDNISYVEAEPRILKLFDCTSKHTDKANIERVDCSQQIVGIMYHMPPGDVDRFSRTYLEESCTTDQSTCEAQKSLLLELLVQVGTAEAQRVMLDYVLNNPNATEERLTNAFFSMHTLDTPLLELVSAVKSHCVGSNMELHKKHELSTLQRRACLSLGALLRAIYHRHPNTARDIIHVFHEWLQHEIHLYGEMISVENHFDDLNRNYELILFIETKTILLDAIKNAAMKESRDIVLQYAKPGKWHASWRHSAVNALENYDCQRSATALLNMSIHDEDQNIRIKSLDAYNNHPLGYTWGANDQDILAYSMGAVHARNMTRMKRSTKQNLIEKLTLEFICGLPTIDWVQKIGSKEVGAQFGVVVRNQIKLHLSPVEGYFEVDIFNSVFVSAHVNFIVRWKSDIFRAEVCYRADFRFYNMSPMVDYSTDMMQDFVTGLDRHLEFHMDEICDALNKQKQLLGEWKPKFKGFYDTFLSSWKTLFSDLRELDLDFSNLEEFYKNMGETIEEWYAKLGNAADEFGDKVHESINELQEKFDYIVTRLKEEMCKEFDYEFDLSILDDIIRRMNITQGLSDPEAFVKAIIDQMKSMNPPRLDLDPGLRNVINELVKQVRLIPDLVKEIKSHIKDLKFDIGNLADFEWNKCIKHALKQSIVYSEDFQSDALDFYTDVIDHISLTLQFLVNAIEEALEFLEFAVKQLTTSPTQAMNDIQRAVRKIEQSMTMLLSGKDWLDDSYSKMSKLWMQLGEDNEKMVDMLDLCLIDINNTLSHDQCVPPHVREKLKMNKIRTNILTRVNKTLATLRENLSQLQYAADQYRSAKDKFMQAVEDFKNIFEQFKKVVETARSFIQSVFGIKYHPRFPHIVRDTCDGVCGCGIYPSEMFGYKGVQYLAEEGYTIVAPVDGRVRNSKARENEVIIEPHDPDMSNQKIVLSFVTPEQFVLEETAEYGGVFVTAGQVIGTASRSECQPNFIFMADVVKNTQPGHKNDDSGGEVCLDPEKYNNDERPNPAWVVHCSHTEFKELKRITIEKFFAKHFKDIGKKIKQKAIDIGSKILDAITNIPINLPDDLDVRVVGESAKRYVKEAKSFMREVERLTLQEEEMFDVDYEVDDSCHRHTNVTVHPVDNIPPIHDYINFNNYTLLYLKQQLNEIGASDLSNKIDIAVQAVTDKLNEKLDDLLTNYDGAKLRYENSVLGYSNDGSISKVMANLQNKEQDCTGRPFVNIGEGNLCESDSGCTRISCIVRMKMEMYEVMVETSIEHDPCNKLILLSADGNPYAFTYTNSLPSQYLASFDFEQRGVTFHVTIVIDISTSTESVTVLSLSAKGYTGVYCSRTIGIVDNFFLIPCDRYVQPETSDQSNSRRKRDIEQTLLNTKVSDFIQLSERLQVPDEGNIIHTLEELRTGVLFALDEQFSLISSIDGSEIFTPKDVQTSDYIPVAEKTIRFFRLPIVVPVIPLIFRFEIYAGGTVGLDFGMASEIIHKEVNVTLAPWIAGTVGGKGTATIAGIGGGMELTGHIMKNKFPFTFSILFEKYPIEVRKILDGELIPLVLKMSGFFKMWIIEIPFTIFTWTAPSIKYNIFTKVNYIDDESAPGFGNGNSCADTTKTRRSLAPIVGQYSGSDRFRVCRVERGGSNDDGVDDCQPAPKPCTDECFVEQKRGRHYSDPAFYLEAPFHDPDSQLVTRFAVGTHTGGTDVMPWTEMEGPTQVVPINLNHNGIQLHFTVQAENTQGLKTTVQCILDTYDVTPPHGRFEPDHFLTSRPDKLTGSLIVIDDSPLLADQYVGVGVGEGFYGDQVNPWHGFEMTKNPINKDAEGALGHFATERTGKLTSTPFKSVNARYDENCAQECLDSGDICVSFDYEYATETCDLQSVIEGPEASLRVSGSYNNFERLGAGHSAWFDFENLDLIHGEVYYYNAKLMNSLGYESYITTDAVVVDLTPPAPGPVGDALSDVSQHDGCSAAVTQADRCVNVTPLDNHRIIKDGEGAETVFNGNWPGKDKLYTVSYYYICANWDGFYDPESDIWGYTWAVGTSACGTNISDFDDPHAHLSHKSYWTHQGYIGDIHLPDGQYYVTAQALNSVVYGGAMVTTVCHSTPLTIDTTPPILEFVEDVFYDEVFDLMAFYYKGTDPDSGIMRTDIALGETKHDAFIRSYSRHDPGKDGYEMVTIDDADLPEGILIWPRVRVVNNVELLTAGHSEVPVMFDTSPPIAGSVLDGDVHMMNIDYQPYNDRICAQWYDWYDPESGIDTYFWGVGSEPQKDDIMEWVELRHTKRYDCYDVLLLHNHTYYSTIRAYNLAINKQSTNKTSSGVLVDLTDPVVGWVSDGPERNQDIEYSFKTATVETHWGDYYDPESGITDYNIRVDANGIQQNEFKRDGNVEYLEDHTFVLHHGDYIEVEVEAVDGATRTGQNRSSGYRIDLTPPEVESLKDHRQDFRFQVSASEFYGYWHFRDEESGIKDFKVKIQKHLGGSVRKVWPVDSPLEVYTINEDKEAEMSQVINLQLENGAMYSWYIEAANKATLTGQVESRGVIIDTTPPTMSKVNIGHYGPDEVLNSDGEVIHADPHGITCSWDGSDDESGILHFQVAVGKQPYATDVTRGYILYPGDVMGAYIDGLDLNVTSESNGTLYFVTVKATNGAGVDSIAVTSNPIHMYGANVPGTIYDGRDDYEDTDYTRETTAVALTFAGFESPACGISGYEWAVGTAPGYSDILPFSSVGLVMKNESHGHAQGIVPVVHGQTLYASVIAHTGHRCHEDIIHSASDGVLVDTQLPIVTIELLGMHSNITETKQQKLGPVYQEQHDSIEFRFDVDDDTSTVRNMSWEAGYYPFDDKIHAITPTLDGIVPVKAVTVSPGESVFFTIYANDFADNHVTSVSQPLHIDITSPILNNLNCNNFISERHSELKCTWDSVLDLESSVTGLEVGVGNKQWTDDLVPFQKLSPVVKTWHWMMFSLINQIEDSDCYVTVRLTNPLHLHSSYVAKVFLDVTPPETSDIYVVTEANGVNYRSRQECQISVTTLAVVIEEFHDSESGIERYELGVGSFTTGDDIHPFTSIGLDTYAVLDKLSLIPGRRAYASVRAMNRAGLYSDIVSYGISISPKPHITIKDGLGDKDLDFQQDMSVISGTYSISDDCPIISRSWKIVSVDFDVIQNFTMFYNNRFENDELQLQNLKTYFTVVELTDALNRTIIGKSNGVTILIEPPVPGAVRDGPYIGEDRKYQESVSEVGANWDEFGNDEPGLEMSYYEVAIGDNPGNVKSRVNVHYFVDVGLNRTHVFRGLELRPKVLTYYVTVRAHAVSGSYVEATSNGVRVGYSGGMFPGQIELPEFVNKSDSLTLSWSRFKSEFRILYYKVGLISHSPSYTNETLPCEEYYNLYEEQFNIMSLQNVGRNTTMTFTRLNFEHAESYYVIVMSADEADQCLAAEPGKFMIDLTPPTDGHIITAGISKNVEYVIEPNYMHITWEGFEDPESGIKDRLLQIFTGGRCDVRSPGEVVYVPVTDARDIKTEEKLEIFDIKFNHSQPYRVRITVINNAGSELVAFSNNIFLDSTPMEIGTVVDGKDWRAPITYQSSNTTLHAVIAINPLRETLHCPSSRSLLKDVLNEFTAVSGRQFVSSDFGGREYDRTVIEYNNWNYDVMSHMTLIMHRNLSKQYLDSSAVESREINLNEGDYVFHVRPAAGHNVITSITLSTHSMDEFILFDLPVVYDIDDDEFNEQAQGGDLDWDDTPTNDTIGTTTESPLSPEYNTSTLESLLCVDNIRNHAIGLNILGFPVGNKSENWFALLWARDIDTIRCEWVQLNYNPTTQPNEFILKTQLDYSEQESTWSVLFFMDGVLLTALDDVTLPTTFTSKIRVWSHHGYVPPLRDPFNPFSTMSEVYKIQVPLPKDKDCHYGLPFIDLESGVEEVWVGVSTNNSNGITDDIYPFTKISTLCHPCVSGCDVYQCDPDCTLHEDVDNDYKLIHIAVNDLDLYPGDVEWIDLETEDNMNQTYFASIRYFVVVKIINEAGLETFASSSGVRLDPTPPKMIEVIGTDINYSTILESAFQGSTDSLSAWWEFEERESVIVKYRACIGTAPMRYDIMQWTDFELEKILYVQNLQLEEDITYFVTAEATNAAGLATTGVTKGVTIFTQYPDVKNVTMVIKGTVVDEETGVYYYETNDRLTLSVGDNIPPEVEKFEWSVGYSPDNDYMMPYATLKPHESQLVEIVDGIYYFNGNRTEYTLIQQFGRDMAGSNMTLGWDPDDPGSMRIEPGRCMHYHLFALNKANLKTRVQLPPLCITRTEDVIVNAFDAKIEEMFDIGAGRGSLQGYGIRGKLLYGKLSNDVLSVPYHIDCNLTYSPYIVDHKNTINKTSRTLLNRIVDFGEAMYISPLGEAILEGPLKVTLPYDSLGEMETDEIPAIVYWDSESRQWRDISESCGLPSDTDFDSKEITGMICGNSITSVKRSTHESILPTQLALILAAGIHPNRAPRLTNTSYNVTFNDKLDARLEYTDPENDEVIFKFVGEPTHGSASITPAGRLVYLPKENYWGTDSIRITMMEINVPPIFTPQNTTETISLHTLEPMLPPMIFLVPANPRSDGSTLKHIENYTVITSENVDLHYEGNTTFKDIGMLYLCDPNKQDTIYLLYNETNIKGIPVDVQEVTPATKPPEIKHDYIRGCLTNNIRQFRLTSTSSVDYHGISRLILIGTDEHVFSQAINLRLNVYISPCHHGHCVPLVTAQSCNSPARTSTFDTFACSCDLGYEGQYCKYEIDECATDPCNSLSDCQDFIGYHQCHVNVVRMIGVVAAAIWIMAVLAVMAVKFKTEYEKRVTAPVITNSVHSAVPVIPAPDYDVDEPMPDYDMDEPMPDYDTDEAFADPERWSMRDISTHGMFRSDHSPFPMAYTNHAFVDTYKIDSHAGTNESGNNPQWFHMDGTQSDLHIEDISEISDVERGDKNVTQWMDNFTFRERNQSPNQPPEPDK